MSFAPVPDAPDSVAAVVPMPGGRVGVIVTAGRAEIAADDQAGMHRVRLPIDRGRMLWLIAVLTEAVELARE